MSFLEPSPSFSWSRAWSATPKARIQVWIQLILALSVIMVYAQVWRFDFVNWDDPLFVRNPHIQAGLSWAGLRWAFSSFTTYNWIPLTLLSHMLDFTFFGANPGAHHLVNVAFHLANTLLCFHILHEMTEDQWKSALVALIFALHPTHVESVAWVAERKDVLSAFFLLLTIKTYFIYIKTPTIFRHIVFISLFILGLLAKSMLVTLPILLLILDYWPLARLWNGNSSYRLCILEKIPLLIISFIIGCITIWAQASGGAVVNLKEVTIPLRLANAMVSYLRYLTDFLAPLHLTVFYPFPSEATIFWEGIGAAFALISLAVLAFRWRFRFPFLFAGLLWYIVSLLPVIGIIQVGEQSHADRYTYVPFFGLAIFVAWGLNTLIKRFPAAVNFAWLVVGSWITLLFVLALFQTSTWHDSVRLWRHNQVITGGNSFTAACNLGGAYVDEGRYLEGIQQYQEVIRRWPNEIKGFTGLGEALLRLGRREEALQTYKVALELDASDRQSLYRSAMIHLSYNRLREANGFMIRFLVSEWAQADQLEDADSVAGGIIRTELGKLKLRQGNAEEARRFFRQALERDPENASASAGFAAALFTLGHRTEGISMLESFLRLHPHAKEAREMLENLKRIPECPGPKAQN